MPQPIKIDNEYLKYCINDYERNVINVRLKYNSNVEASKYLKISRQSVDKVINRSSVPSERLCCTS